MAAASLVRDTQSARRRVVHIEVRSPAAKIVMDEVKLNSEVLEVRTGRPKPLGRSGVTSAIDKRTCDEPVWVGTLGLEGDEQAEAVIHGGPYQAVLQNPVHHYDTWRAEFPDIAARFGPGGFGENIVAAIFDETNLCIGDTLRLGGALVCVTQSRQPCYKLNHRFGHPSGQAGSIRLSSRDS